MNEGRAPTAPPYQKYFLPPSGTSSGVYLDDQRQREEAAMTVDAWMRRSPVSVTPDTRVAEALRLCRQHGIRRLPVVKEGKLVGVVREGDLLRLTPSEATTLDRHEMLALLDRMTVARIVAPAVTIPTGSTLTEAARLLAEGAEELLVVADGLLRGILTRADCLRGLLAETSGRAA